ncbi:hypothetical protein PIB30_015062 [Stylosanthes scabra]|uniref:Uncharacterized protein n=1 Tax=Stylosanthes scabra TaxID=79078 RepID=A0ABU6Z4H7_9FABA|nr:hypothetical protein [Stylosanthes scabra]
MAVAHPRPSTWCSRTNYWKDCAPAPLWPRVRVSPLRHILGLHSRARPRDEHRALTRWPLHLIPHATSLSLTFTLISSFLPKFSQLKNLSHSHTNTQTPILMDKKEKAKRPVCKMYASQAAARSEATLKPPTAPKALKEPKKKPIFIDLTADSESEDTTRASSKTHFSSVASCSEGHSAPTLRRWRMVKKGASGFFPFDLIDGFE